MAKTKTPTQLKFDAIVKDSITAILKPNGFRKTGLNFHRRLNRVVQVVNIQLSRGSSINEKLFYVNVGIAFDEICLHLEKDIVEKPKEHECDARGFRRRIENLLPGCPERFVVNAKESIPTTDLIQSYIEVLSEELNEIDSVPSLMNHRWLSRMRPTEVSVLTFYLSGDFESAAKETIALANQFSNRPKLDDPKWWVDELELEKLSSLI